MSILENIEKLKSAILSKNWDDVCDAYNTMTGDYIEVDNTHQPNFEEPAKDKKKPGRPKKPTKSGVNKLKKILSSNDETGVIEIQENKKDGITTTKKESRSEPVRFKGNTFVDDGKLHSDERGSITGIAKIDAKLKKTWKKEKSRQAYKPLVIECSTEKCKETLEIDTGLYYSESNHYCNKCLSKKRNNE